MNPWVGLPVGVKLGLAVIRKVESFTSTVVCFMLKHTHRFQPKTCSPIINSDQLIQNEVMPFSFTCCAAFAIPLIPLCLPFGSFWAVVYLTGKQAKF